MCEEKYGVSMTFEFLMKKKEERSFKVASVDLIMRYLTVLGWRYRYGLDGGMQRQLVVMGLFISRKRNVEYILVRNLRPTKAELVMNGLLTKWRRREKIRPRRLPARETEMGVTFCTS